MAPPRKSQRLLGNQASRGFNETHASLDYANTTNEVSVISHNTNVQSQHISNQSPSLPQKKKGESRWTQVSISSQNGKGKGNTPLLPMVTVPGSPPQP